MSGGAAPAVLVPAAAAIDVVAMAQAATASTDVQTRSRLMPTISMATGPDVAGPRRASPVPAMTEHYPVKTGAGLQMVKWARPVELLPRASVALTVIV